jgi:hypothetical protein
MNDRKVDEYVHLEGKSVEDIENELDRIVNKRIRRLEREFNVPKAQNESLRKGNNSMKLRINEEEIKPRRTRRSKLDIIDELERNGYELLDTGYGDWHYYAKPYEKNWDIKGFADRSDTPGLKAYMIYGRLKGSTYKQWYDLLYDFAKENYPDNWTEQERSKFFTTHPYLDEFSSSPRPTYAKLYIEVNQDLMQNEGFEEPPYEPEFYHRWENDIRFRKYFK